MGSDNAIQRRRSIRRATLGGVSIVCGAMVLLLWAYILVARGYEVDETGGVGYALATDYVLFFAGVLLLLAPPVVWLRNGYRSLKKHP